MLTCTQVVEAFNYGLNIPGLSPTHSFQLKYHYTSPNPWFLEFKALGRTINTFALLYHTSLSIRVTGLCVFYSQFVNEDSSKTPSSETHLSRVHQTSKQLLNKVSNENTIQQVFLKVFQQNTAWRKPFLGLKLVYTLFEVGDCNFTQHQRFDHTYTKQPSYLHQAATTYHPNLIILSPSNGYSPLQLTLTPNTSPPFINGISSHKTACTC